MKCRACESTDGTTVLDLGRQPASDSFPPATDHCVDPTFDLSLWLCQDCGLAQLRRDDTSATEPRAVEPQALLDQARDAMETVAAAGWLPETGTVREFPSPHGGSWLGHAARLGLHPTGNARADVLIDSFGVMHDPDQGAAFAERAAMLAPDGVLLLQFQTLSSIVTGGQWTALRHGHFGYYSLTALSRLLHSVGLEPLQVWHFPLYGGTALLAVRHAGSGSAIDPSIARMLAAERSGGITTPEVVGGLQAAYGHEVQGLRAALSTRSTRVFGYGAASRAVALLAAAALTSHELAGIADASTAKQGRRMPGTDIPIIAPDELVASEPETVVLFLPDLLPEVAARFPAIADRLVTLSDLIGGSAR